MEGSFVLFALILSSVFLVQVDGVSLNNQFYPYGQFQADASLQRSTAPGPRYQTVQLTQAASFYGNLYSRITISSNGMIIFGDQIPTFASQHEPESFPAPVTAILAPFWAEADFLQGSGGSVFYRETGSPALLQRAENEINQTYSRTNTAFEPVSLSKLVIVTWKDLRSASDRNAGNTFQCVIAFSSSSTFIFFLYADNLMTWTGSPPALIGFNAGNGVGSFTLPTSLTADVLEVTRIGNTGNNGKWLFRVDGSDVESPGAIIGLDQTDYVTPEDGVRVVICATHIMGSFLEQPTITSSLVDMTANNPLDYRLGSQLTVSTSGNRTQWCTTVIIISDSIYERDEVFEIRFSTSIDTIVLFPQMATITIRDDDFVTVNYISRSVIEEDDRVALICAQLAANLPECRIGRDVEVDYFTFPGDAEDGLDYDGSNGTMTVHPPSCISCIGIPIIDDTVFEEKEQFHFAFTSNNSNIRVNNSLPFGNITITDKDGPSVRVEIAQASYTVQEGGQVTICTSITAGQISQPLVIGIRTGYSPKLIGKNVATGKQDFLTIHEHFTFLPSQPNEVKCVNVTTLRDSIYEGTEYTAIVINTTTSVTLSRSETTLVIQDRNTVSVAVEKTEYSYKEGQDPNNFLSVCANLTGEIERHLHIRVTFHPLTATEFHFTRLRNGDVEANINDIIFTVPGTSSSLLCEPFCTECTNVRIVDDNIFEAKFENFSLSLSHSDPAVQITSTSTTVTIEDNNKIDLSVVDPPFNTELSEGSTTVPSICLMRRGQATINFGVRLVPRGITATENEDFRANNNLILFSPSDTMSCSSVTSVTILEDLVVEGDETLELVLVPEDPERILIRNSRGARILTITDNDYVSVRFMESTLNVTEGEGRVEVCVEMTGLTDLPLTVTASTSPDTAEVGIDFLSQSRPLQLPVTDQRVLDDMYNLSVSERLARPPPTSSPVCTNITIIDDDILELVHTKSFFLNLSHPAAAVSFAQPHIATVFITDDDSVKVLVDEASRNVSVTEGEAVRICARMLGRADFSIPASFQPQAIPDSAEGGVDFVTMQKQISFPAKTTLQCVDILTIDNSIVERREEFEVELSITERSDMKVTLGSNSTVVVTIVDNDFVTVGFEAPDYSIVEGEGVVLVCATLTGRLEIPISVVFSVRDPPGRNQGDPDYVPVPSIPFFEELSNASSRRECVSITIINDTILEDTEYFDVVLNSSDSVVHLTQESSRVYIIDDDGVRVGLKTRTLSVPEEEGTVPICVELVGRFQQRIEVQLESQPSTAQAGVDFRSLSDTLVFNPARRMMQQICVNVSVIDDSTLEDDEIFTVSLQVANAAVSIHIRQTTITIVDNDSITLALTTNQTALVESVGVVEVCVEMTGVTEKIISYQLEVTPLEAMLGSDIHFAVAPLSRFLPTSPETLQTQCHQVSVVDDAILESTEHFEAVLVPPVGVARVLVGVSRVRFAIADNDMVTVGFTQTQFTVNEDGTKDERTVNVCVQMTGEIEREVSVSVISQPGSADAQDFDAVAEDITFTPGATFNPLQCFSVYVKPDRLVEGTEFFSLVMSSSIQGVIVEPATAQFTVTEQDVVCLFSSLDTSRGYFSWPDTFPGEMASVKCENGSTTRLCSMIGTWAKPITTDCYVSTNELFRYIEKHGFTLDNLKELLFAVLQLVRENEQPDMKYVQIVYQIFDQFIGELENNLIQLNNERFGIVLEIVNAMQMWPRDVLKVSSSSVVNSFERISANVFKINGFSTLTKALHSLSFHSDKGRVSDLFPQNKTGLKYQFARNVDGVIEILSGDRNINNEASITLPKSLTAHLAAAEAELFLTYYGSRNMFPLEGNATEQEKYVTSVVSASFAGHSINNLNDDVIITLKLNSTNSYNVTCVYWDFEANDGQGSWMEDGCALASLENGEATCACNRLANFACLVDTSLPITSTEGLEPPVANTLSILSIAGVCLSILALAFTIITLLVFSKLRKRDSTKFRLQLCTAMILMLVFFVAGIYQVETFEICVVASALLHYFTLVCAMWMASDALLMFLKLTVVFAHPSTCYIVIVSLLCWLLPIPAVVVPIAIDRNFAVNLEYCFIGHNTIFFATLVGPIGALLVFTLVIFLVAICIVIGYSTSRFKGSKKASKRKGACRSIFGILGVMFLFGLTWVFGAFTIRGGPHYFIYLFVGFNSLQGVFVFIFFAVFAKETLDLWLQTCGCKQKKKRLTLTSAITGVVPLKPQRTVLDTNADRLKVMEEIDLEKRLTMNSWDIMYVPPQNQVDAVLHSGNSPKQSREWSQGQGELLRELNPPPARSSATPGSLQQISCSLEPGSNFQSVPPSPPCHDSSDYSPIHSIDSAQCMSTADSGILMDKGGKSTPSPPPQGKLQHPQSGSTPRHVHSVSGIGYISADSSMEVLPQREEDCCYTNKEPIMLAPNLRPRAVPNEYARVDVDNM